MDLRDRLDWIQGLGSSRHNSVRSERDEPRPLPWGEIADTPLGQCTRIYEERSLDSVHGQFTLGRLLERSPRTLGLLAGRSSLFPEDVVFFDTETTGLAGGSGTVAFLVGIGYYSGNGFVIEQFFARDFDEEAALLFLTRERLRRFKVWVTYNGKSFDAPLINQRLVFHRLDRKLAPEAHLDLLYFVRRFWKKHLGECSLARAEQVLVGVRRASDVPGYLVPEIYFRYLRNREPWPLKPVFDHNVQDVLSLVVLLNHTAHLLEHPEAHVHVASISQGGRLLASIGVQEEAVRFLEKAARRVPDPRERKRLLLQLASLYKRQGRAFKAVPLWEEAARLPGFSVEPYEELAKHYEHRTRELQRAREWTEKALQNVKTLRVLRLDRKLETVRHSLQHRLSRLERKLRRK